jgi:glycosyltransferase involved in cell wall biosynthesis
MTNINENVSGKKVQYVSIIVPVLNGERNIDTFIDSVSKLKYPNNCFELIIVDNGSRDKTVDMVRNFQNNLDLDIKLLFEKGKGPYRARNLGVRNAKGDIMVFTDIDCIVNSDWLTNIVSYFSDDTIGGVAGKICPKKGNGIVERYTLSTEMWSQKSLSNNSSRLPFAQTGNAAYRKEVFSKIGYFAEIIGGGDADCSWRMLLETDYKLAYAEDAIVIHDHKIGLRGLFKQTFRYGCSNVFLKQKYGDRCEKSCGNDIKPYRNVAGYITKVASYLIKNRDDLLLIFPALVFRFGFSSGKVYTRYIKREKHSE